MSTYTASKSFFIAIGTLMGLLITFLMYLSPQSVGIYDHVFKNDHHIFVYLMIYVFYTLLYFLLGTILKRPNVSLYLFSFNIFLPFLYGILLYYDPLNKFEIVQGGVTLVFFFSYIRNFVGFTVIFMFIFLLSIKEIIKIFTGYDLSNYNDIDKLYWIIKPENENNFDRIKSKISIICKAYFNENYILKYIKKDDNYEIGIMVFDIKNDVVQRTRKTEEINDLKEIVNNVLLNNKEKSNILGYELIPSSNELFNVLKIPLDKKNVQLPNLRNIKNDIINFPQKHPGYTALITLIIGSFISEFIRYLMAQLSTQ